MYDGDVLNKKNTCSYDVSCEVDVFCQTCRQTDKHVNGKKYYF